MNFVRVWLSGVIHPGRSLDELKDKPAPQWGLRAVLIRFVTTALIEPFTLYLLGRKPFAPSYLTFLSTKDYYRAEVFFLPLFGLTLWLLMSALAHVLLRVAGKGSDMDRILNIVGLGMLIPMPVLWACDVAMIALNIFTLPWSAIIHATVQVWEAGLQALGFRRLLGLRILPAILLALLINALYIGLAMIFAR
jgi:Yip1 domain